MTEEDRTIAADQRDAQADARAGQADARDERANSREHSRLGALVWLFFAVCVIGLVLCVILMRFSNRLDSAKRDRDIARYEFVAFERDMARIHCMNLPAERRERQPECDPDHYPLPPKPKGVK